MASDMGYIWHQTSTSSGDVEGPRSPYDSWPFNTPHAWGKSQSQCGGLWWQNASAQMAHKQHKFLKTGNCQLKVVVNSLSPEMVSSGCPPLPKGANALSVFPMEHQPHSHTRVCKTKSPSKPPPLQSDEVVTHQLWVDTNIQTLTISSISPHRVAHPAHSTDFLWNMLNVETYDETFSCYFKIAFFQIGTFEKDAKQISI